MHTPPYTCTYLHTSAHISIHLHMYSHIHTHLHTFAHTYAACAQALTPVWLCPQARSLQAVARLVKLFNHANQEVQRHATGAMRNLVYDNADNKLALVEENGIFELLRSLREQDDELRKNVTGGPAPRPPLCHPSLGPHGHPWGMSPWSWTPAPGPVSPSVLLSALLRPRDPTRHTQALPSEALG